MVAKSSDFIRKDSNEIIMVQSDYNQNNICFNYDTCNVQNYSTDSYHNKNLYSVTDNDFFNSAGPGFEYDPQAGNVVSSVEEDTSCHGNWSWFDRTMLDSDIPYTQPIVRLYAHENLHSHTAVFTNGVDHEVDQSVYTCKGSSSNQAIRSPNCIMNVTNFSCFYEL